MIVNWLTDRRTFLLAVALYGVSTAYSVFLWRKGFRRDEHVNYLLLLGGFALHTGAMIQRGFSLNRCPVNNLFEATIFLGWALALACLVVALLPRLRFVVAFAAPLLFAIGVFALMPPLDTPPGPRLQTAGWLLSLHAALVLLAYGAFGLGAVAAAMFLFQQHELKFNKLRAVLSLLPPIQRLERITATLALLGFVLLTAGLFAGAYLPRPAGMAYWQDVKVRWSALIWVLYLGLMLARWGWTLSSRRFAWGIVGVFAFLLLTFWGTNLLSPLHHP